MHRRTEHRHRVPFGDQKRTRTDLCFGFPIHFCKRALIPTLRVLWQKEHIRHRFGQFPVFFHRPLRCRKHMLDVVDIDKIAECVARIMVCGNKVAGNTVLLAIGQKLRQPLARAGGRTAHADQRIDLLDRPCGGFIQLKIVLLLSDKEASEIRLVPDLEIPLLHFFFSVAVDQKTDEAFDIVRPCGK